MMAASRSVGAAQPLAGRSPWPRRAALAGCALLGACAAGPDFVRPDAPATPRYTAAATPDTTVSAGGRAQRFDAGGALPADWWRLFQSPPLDRAVRQALAANPTLAAAEASLRQSQDLLRAGYGLLYPQLELGFDATRQRGAPLEQGSAAPARLFNVVTLSGTVSYALDLFGGQRRGIEALQADRDYQRYLSKAAYLSLSANVVTTAIARATYAAQVQATQQLVASLQETLELLRSQVQGGTAPYASLLAPRAQLGAYQANLAALRQRRDQADHLLAVLQGRAPADIAAPTLTLNELTLPQDLPLSLPSALVRQRPDILAAEARLHAASAGIGVATAAMLPSLTLSADYGKAGASVAALGAAGATFWSIGPALAAPLFHGGALRYQRQAALDAYQREQANYRQAVLSAFQQVADTLDALQHDAQAVQAELAAVRAGEEARALLRVNYRAGLASYGDVLAADGQFYLSTLDYLQAVGQRQQDTAALFAALGGGWWNAAADGPEGRP